MKFNSIVEAVKRNIGQSGQTLRDHQLQEIKDAINHAQDRIYLAAAYWPWLVQEGSITPVTNQTVYTLDDYCIKPLSFWTESTNAGKIEYIHVRDADRYGWRSSSLAPSSLGPYTVTWYPDTSSATASGAAGATAGISVSEGAAAVTKSGGTAFASAHVGRIIQIDGEGEDYVVSAVGGDNALTLDRNYRARMTGNGTSGAGSGATQVRWAIGPVGRKQVELFGAQTGGNTVYYRFQKRHRRLVNGDETPELPEDYHFMLVAGATVNYAVHAEKWDLYRGFKSEWDAGLRDLLEESQEEQDMEHQAGWDSPVHASRIETRLPRGTYSRSGNFTT